MTVKENAMNPRYDIGQKVIIKPAKEQPISLRESDIEAYAGQTGEVSNYHWISPRTGQVFYIYTVRLSKDYKEVVLYEDEMEACLN